MSIRELRLESRRIGNLLSGMAHTKWFVGGTGLAVIVWTILRGIPAWPLAAYGMSIPVFVAIDIVTAFPYVVFIRNIVTGLGSRPAWKLMLDGVGVSVMFMAPYLYVLWSAGANIPRWTLVVVVLIIAMLALVGPIRKITSAVSARVAS